MPTSKRPFIICLANKKGGVGKTMAAYNLPSAFAELGYRVLLVDFDDQHPHAELHQITPKAELPAFDHALKHAQLDTVILPSAHYEHLFVTVGDRSITHEAIQDEYGRDELLVKALQPLYGFFDYVFIDTPGKFDLVAVNALTASDLMILCCDVDRESLRSGIETIRRASPVLTKFKPDLEIGSFYKILVSNFDYRDASMNAWFLNELAPYATQLLKTRIHRTTALKKSRSSCQPISLFVEETKARDIGPTRAVQDFKDLAQELVEITNNLQTYGKTTLQTQASGGGTTPERQA